MILRPMVYNSVMWLYY